MVGFLVSGFWFLVVSLGVASAQTDDKQPSPVHLTMVALHATNEHRGVKQVDPGLEEVRDAIADLDADTYRKVKAAEISAPFNQETRAEINAKYTLCITPLSREADNHVRMNVCVQMAAKNPGETPVNAITTTVTMGPGKQFKLRGLKMDKGELVVVISLKR